MFASMFGFVDKLGLVAQSIGVHMQGLLGTALLIGCVLVLTQIPKLFAIRIR